MPKDEAEAFIQKDDAQSRMPVVQVAQTVIEERTIARVRAHG